MAEPSGEKRLLYGLLLDAIAGWQGNRAFGGGPDIGPRARQRQEAEAWLFGDDENYPFFSFADVCAYLGIDPEGLRRKLRESLSAPGSAIAAFCIGRSRTRASSAVPRVWPHPRVRRRRRHRRAEAR